jgi:hypothetical protein
VHASCLSELLRRLNRINVFSLQTLRALFYLKRDAGSFDSKRCRMSTTPEDAGRAMALLEVLAYLKHL